MYTIKKNLVLVNAKQIILKNIKFRFRKFYKVYFIYKSAYYTELLQFHVLSLQTEDE